MAEEYKVIVNGTEVLDYPPQEGRVEISIEIKEKDPFDDLTQYLKGLSNEERMDIFDKFCTHCGSDNPSCQCWNDE